MDSVPHWKRGLALAGRILSILKCPPAPSVARGRLFIPQNPKHRHSGARVKRASPESITTIGSMDSGPAPRGASRNDDFSFIGRFPTRRSRTASRCEMLLLGLLRRQLIAQFVARKLADLRPRQVIDEIECGGNLMLAELAGEECPELVQREWHGAVAQFDKGLRRLAAVLVRYADHDHFLHRGVFIDRLLDHLRIDVEAAGDDHVLLAIDQKEIAVPVHVADVAGQETIADESL